VEVFLGKEIGKYIESKLFSAKNYVVDGEYTIVGSANFTKESFWNNLESIVMFKDSNEVEKVETQFKKLWDSYKTVDFINTDKKNEFKKIFHRIKSR